MACSIQITVFMASNEKEIRDPALGKSACTLFKLTTKCWVGSIDWLGLVGWFKFQWFGANPRDDLLVCDLAGEFILHLFI